MLINARDVRDIGHYGTSDFAWSLRTQEEAESAREYIKMSFERVGG
jgi:predicted transport protein